MKTLNDRLSEGQEIDKAITRTLKAGEMKVYRLRKRVKTIIKEPYTYFFTFTLDNNHISRNYITIERKIKETLAGASDYVINNDLGTKNARLHYHGVASFNFQLDYSTLQDIYQYGAIQAKTIRTPNDKAITEYISKLGNHAIKENVSRIVRKRQPQYFKKECDVSWIIETKLLSPNLDSWTKFQKRETLTNSSTLL